MDALLQGLNDAQRSAVTSPASVVQVLAPPGSGKTKTLTARVAYLISHEGLQPWNIIVCTFTIKAANEMKARIQGILGEKTASKLVLGTFHGVARRFLIRYGQELGLPKDFSIADTTDTKAILKRIISRNQYIIDPSHARSRISRLKAKGITAEKYATTVKKAEEHEFICVYTEYEDTLKATNQLDFDDLLVRCTELLQKHPACVSSIQAVLIDEYQDTNNVQYELMTLLAQRMRRITIVGDPDQSIYSFRSAEIENLHRMQSDYPESIVINLENNYRSSGRILESAMAVIEQDENRPSKKLLATHCIGEQPTLRHLATAKVEAQWIVEEIHRSKVLTAGILDFSDYAILLRTSALMLSIEQALGKSGIPYRVVGSHRFFDRAEIKIVLDYLRVINQPRHNDALVRIINVPSRKIGDVTVKALLEEAETQKMTLWDVILQCAQGRRRPTTKMSAQAQKGIDVFVNLILTSRQKLLPVEGGSCNLFDLISHVLQKLSFESYLKATHKDNWQDRMANVNELVAQATQMATTGVDGEDDPDNALPVVEGIEQRKDTAADVLSQFLANVALSAAVDTSDKGEVNQVTLSTIHAAKGLEWPVVFIPAVYDGHIPHSRAEEYDEERRLLYVGMTRAQGLLYLSCPVKQSGQDETTVSRFISPRNIQKFLSFRGPVFDNSVVRDLSQILGRSCPSEADLDRARRSVENTEDDRYPFSREEMDGDGNPWDVSNDNEGAKLPPFKRRKTEPITTGRSTIAASVTIQKTTSISVSKTTVQSRNSGFTSASTYQKMLQEAESVRMLVSAQRVGVGKAAQRHSEGAEAKPRSRPVKPRAAGQGSITSFFGRRTSSLSEEAEVLVGRTRPPALVRSPSQQSTQDGSLGGTSNMQSSTSSQPSRAHEPRTFSSHRPRTTPMTSKPRKANAEPAEQETRYVLLSSSPTQVGDENDGSRGRSGVDDDGGGPCSPSHQSGKPASGDASVVVSGFQSASTLHTTSMAQVQGQAGAQRKPLGMRRSVQGWSLKPHRPFRPPQRG